MKKNIEEFLPSYPEQDDTNFTSKLWSKKEFRELIPKPFEKPPKKGEAYIHQKYGTRFFTEFDRNLRLDEPGTGKSCIVVHSAELFKQYFLNDFSPPGKKRVTIKKCIILVKNPTLESNIREQIVCRCTSGIYETPKILKAMRENKGFESASRKEVNKWDDIMTYRAFAKHVKLLDENHLNKYMTDVAIYVDEAQYLVGSKGSDKKIEVEDNEDADTEEPTEMYELINKAFHSGRRNKIMLLTATPMINTAIQIIPLINLLIPTEEAVSMTMAQLTDLSFEDLLKKLEPSFGGLVTYIRRPKTDVLEISEGTYIQGLDMPLELASMTDLQWDLYKQQSEKEFSSQKKAISNFVFPDGSFGEIGYRRFITSEKKIPKVNDDEFKNILRDTEKLEKLSPKFVRILDICNEIKDYPMERKIEKGVIFVFFPFFAKGSGAEIFSLVLEYNGYQRYTEKKTMFMRTGDQSIQLGCGGVSESASQSIKLSKAPRFVLLTGTTDENITHTAMEILHSNENRYGEYIQVVIGTKVLREGISIDNGCAVIVSSPPWNQSAFIQAKDRIFRATSHIYKLEELRREAKERGEDPSKIVIPVKIYSMASIHQTDINIDEKQRVIVSYDDNSLVINFDEEENKYHGSMDGKEVSVTLGKIDQQYSPSSEYQVVKVYDVDGEPTIAILNKPLLKRDPEFQGNMLHGYNIKTNKLYENTVIDTNDVRLYKLMQDKNKVITKVFDVLRSVAVDCPNNFSRNSRPEIKEREIKCWNVHDLPIDYAGKNLYYADDEVNTVISTLRQAFLKDSYLTLSRIFSLFPDIDPIMVSVALDKIIKESIKYPIFDPYGRKQYIKKSDTGVYFISSDPFSFSATPDISYYSKFLIQNVNPKIDLFRSYVIDETGLTSEQSSEGLALDFERKKKWFDSLDLYNQIRIYEEAKQIVLKENKTNDFFDFVFEKFYEDSFEIPEPIQSLAQISSVILREGYTQGKKASVSRTRKKKSAPLQRELERLETQESPDNEIVYIHKILPNLDEEITSYTKGKILGKNLRIYKPSEGVGFRSVNNYEAEVYSTILEKEKKKKKGKYRQKFSIFGVIDKDGEFKIANLLKETKVRKEGKDKEDNRGIYRGRVCKSFLVKTLHEVLAYLKIETLFDRNLYEREYKNTPIDLIKQQYKDITFKGFDDESIRRFMTWENSSMKIIKNRKQKNITKPDLCEIIYNYLKENKMIFNQSQIKETDEGIVIDEEGEES